MTAPRNKGKGRGIAFLRALVGHDGDACITWSMSRSRGYGIVGLNGENFKAHRMMCELTHGAAPSPDHEAAHSCGRGHHGCVNPKHLSWKTRPENQQDRRRHSTHGALSVKRFKLTEVDVADIRAKEGLDTVTNLAARYRVTRSTIRQIHLGKTWPTGDRRKGGFKPGNPNNPFRKNPRAGSRVLPSSEQAPSSALEPGEMSQGFAKRARDPWG